MARLVLGPLLRYAGDTDATVWVEADAACTVEVLGSSARTFAVDDHHYALVHVAGLERASTTAYAVLLDGEQAWPVPGDEWPQPVIRTHAPGVPVRVAFGSCRLCAPNEPPWTLGPTEHDLGAAADALRALACDMRAREPREWPHMLLMLGDQVYADDVSPAVREFIRARRGTDAPPGEQVADFEEYTRLYHGSWGEPAIRWLLSTVPTAMIFDDHDVHDDWNTSQAWVDEMRGQAWWQERIIGGFVSYWVYQHVGNLAPHELATDPVWAAVRECEDAGDLLREHARRAELEPASARWSFVREIGSSRLVMIDSRAGRVLAPGQRSMLDTVEWDWLSEHVRGDTDHLLVGTSLPWLLARGMHEVEAWNEAVCDGAWGDFAASAGEKLRQALDLEHWAAFRSSFDRLAGLLRRAGAGERGAPPASIVVLSGDVHHAYLAEVGFPRGSGVRSRVWQAVCSPFRNPLDAREQRVIGFGFSRAGAVAGAALARLAGVPAPPIRWRLVHDRPWFDNQIGTLELAGRRARMTLDRAVVAPDADGGMRLERAFEHELA